MQHRDLKAYGVLFRRYYPILYTLLGQIDDVIAREKSSENNEEVEFTPAMLTEMAGLRGQLADVRSNGSVHS